MKDTEMVIQHVQALGLKVNWDKSNWNPRQQTVFVGISLDSQLMMASFSSEGDQIFQSGSVISSKQENQTYSVPAVAVYGCSGSDYDSPRSSQSSSATKMSEQRQFASQIRQSCEDEGYTEMYPDVTPLEEQEVTITRGSFREHPIEEVCDNNRCSDGMGSSLVRQVCQRFLGTSLDLGAVEYQGPNNWQIKIRSKHGWNMRSRIPQDNSRKS